MKLKEQIKEIMVRANNDGQTWEDIAGLFGHKVTWAWTFCFEHNKRFTIDQKFVDGLQKMGYELRLVKIKEGGSDG